MSYDDGSNTWPTGTFGPVGKTYGPRDTGGVDGVVKTEGTKNEIVYFLTAGTIDKPYSYPIPAGYLIKSITLDVEEAFAASSTAQIEIGGGDDLTTPMSLVTLGASNVATTGMSNLAGTSAADAVILPNSNALASATGKAKIVVEYYRA